MKTDSPIKLLFTQILDIVGNFTYFVPDFVLFGFKQQQQNICHPPRCRMLVPFNQNTRMTSLTKTGMLRNIDKGISCQPMSEKLV